MPAAAADPSESPRPHPTTLLSPPPAPTGAARAGWCRCWKADTASRCVVDMQIVAATDRPPQICWGQAASACVQKNQV